jgi:integrase
MAKPLSFTPVNTPSGYQVRIPARLSADGKIHRKFFQDKTKAEAFAAKLRKSYHAGDRQGMISAELARDADQATQLLEPYGVSLLEAVRCHIKVLDASSADTSPTIREQWQRAIAHNETHWSARYLNDVKKLPRWVGDEIMDMKTAALTPEFINQEIRLYGAKKLSTIETRERYLSAIRNFEIKHRKAEDIYIMPIWQCAKMLRACETAEQRRCVALLLFAGIRPSAEDGEIRRMDWEMVGADTIEIPARVAKTKTKRYIPILPRLARLLRGHPTSGKVIPKNWPRVYQRLRKAAGLVMEQDATRHTFASNLLAYYEGDEGKTKSAMGHVENSRTLFQHYNEAVPFKAGKKFYS